MNMKVQDMLVEIPDNRIPVSNKHQSLFSQVYICIISQQFAHLPHNRASEDRKQVLKFAHLIYITILFDLQLGLHKQTSQVYISETFLKQNNAMDKYDELLTSKSWIIMNFRTAAYMRGLNVHKKRQIASLTKMYTLYGCLQLNKEFNINPQKTFIKIFDLLNTGTTADLQPNKYISLKDMYYALMLPSGNDSAALLAFYYGYWLDKNTTFANLIFTKARKVDLKDKVKYSNLMTKRFVQYLNEKVIRNELNHKDTNLENPHGLSNKFQASTAWEIAEAGIHFMKNSKEFRQIVKTKKHSGFYLSDQLEEGESFCWENTNILLHEKGFYGIKTGQTVTAGSCLCSYKSVMVKGKYDYEFVVVVLGCSNPDKRFCQTRILCEDLEKHLEKITY